MNKVNNLNWLLQKAKLNFTIYWLIHFLFILIVITLLLKLVTAFLNCDFKHIGELLRKYFLYVFDFFSFKDKSTEESREKDRAKWAIWQYLTYKLNKAKAWFLESFTPSIGPLLKKVLRAILTPQGVSAFISAILFSTWTIGYNVGDWINRAVKYILGQIGEFFWSITLKPSWDNVKGWTDQVLENLQWTWHHIKNTAISIGNKIGNFFSWARQFLSFGNNDITWDPTPLPEPGDNQALQLESEVPEPGDNQALQLEGEVEAPIAEAPPSQERRGPIPYPLTSETFDESIEDRSTPALQDEPTTTRLYPSMKVISQLRVQLGQGDEFLPKPDFEASKELARIREFSEQKWPSTSTSSSTGLKRSTREVQEMLRPTLQKNLVLEDITDINQREPLPVEPSNAQLANRAQQLVSSIIKKLPKI